MLCDLVVKGTVDEVSQIIDLFCDEYDGDLDSREEQNGVSTAWIYCPGIEKEEVVEKLTNVKWMGFIEDFDEGTLNVGISEQGSGSIDDLYTICECDLSGDDRIASQFYPDADFEADIFWESAGDCETIEYSCPCSEWWDQE